MQQTRGPKLKARTPTFAHHSIAFSPFVETRLAVASGANFGLVGNGRLHILEIGGGGVQVAKWYETQDCVYDTAWNESHENQVIAACGDGGLRLFDITLDGQPVRKWHEHASEVVSVDWNNLQKDIFVSSSWDSTVKITSVLTIRVHSNDPTQDAWRGLISINNNFSSPRLYNAVWSPHASSLLAVSAPLGTVKLYDIRQAGDNGPVHEIQVSQSETLDCDWNKYDPNILATASKDGGVRIFDLRKGQEDGLRKMHPMAVRKVAWSPHSRDILASSGYDMTCQVWNRNSPQPVLVHSEHTEFVMGLAWALFDPGLLATGGWDEEVHLFRA